MNAYIRRFPILGFMLFVFAFFAFEAFAQVVATGTTSPGGLPVLVQPISDNDFLSMLWASLGGLKGASALAIAATVVQLLVKFMGTAWGGNLLSKLSGVAKLAIVTVLTLAAGILGLMATGIPLGAALTHATTLAAVSVYVNQWIQQIGKQGAAS